MIVLLIKVIFPIPRFLADDVPFRFMAYLRLSKVLLMKVIFPATSSSIQSASLLVSFKKKILLIIVKFVILPVPPPERSITNFKIINNIFFSNDTNNDALWIE